MGILRFLLALSVLTSHCGPLLGTSLLPGGMAVEAFFMISGFYMALILGGKYATNDRAGMLLFYQNRALRLYPTYLLVMLAGWAVFFAVWLVIGKMPMTTWVEPYQQMNWWQKLVMIVPNWSLIGIDLPCHLFFSPDSGLVFRLPLESVPPVEGGMIWTNQFRSIGPARLVAGSGNLVLPDGALAGTLAHQSAAGVGRALRRGEAVD